MPSLPDEIVTERLRLRRWREGDLDDLARIFARDEVWEFPFGEGRTREQTAAFLDRQLAAWDEAGFGLHAAELRATGELLGYVGLAVPSWLEELMPAVEVGWRLHPDHWGQGLATEGGAAAVRAGFEHLGLERIISIAEPANVRSTRVMTRLGLHEWRRVPHPRTRVELAVHATEREPWLASHPPPG